MRIENDVKLDFKDVLIRPKRSTLNSRNGLIFAMRSEQAIREEVGALLIALPLAWLIGTTARVAVSAE